MRTVGRFSRHATDRLRRQQRRRRRLQDGPLDLPGEPVPGRGPEHAEAVRDRVRDPGRSVCGRREGRGEHIWLAAVHLSDRSQ